MPWQKFTFNSSSSSSHSPGMPIEKERMTEGNVTFLSFSQRKPFIERAKVKVTNFQNAKHVLSAPIISKRRGRKSSEKEEEFYNDKKLQAGERQRIWELNASLIYCLVS